MTTPAGIEVLSARADELAERWDLRLERAYPPGWGGLVFPARTAAGEPAVLKVAPLDREARYQCRALQVLDGRGAVRVLRATKDGSGMLLERCEPGHALSAAGPEVALGVLVDLLPRTWIAVDGFDTLEAEATWWTEHLEQDWRAAGCGYPRRLLDATLEALGWLAGSQGEQVLVNQDLHGDNVLAAAREPWLMIDPKPLTGEREFSAAPIVRSSELGHSARAVRYRLDRLVGDLGLDADRTRGWALAQTIAWCLEDDRVLTGHVEAATWLLDGIG